MPMKRGCKRLTTAVSYITTGSWYPLNAVSLDATVQVNLKNILQTQLQLQYTAEKVFA